jgi:CheY-like chemotaxis protein
MAHGLASQLGGALAVSSQQGLGTTIDLWLPITGEKALDEPEKADRQAPAQARILLVDDDELVRASTASMLAELGYEVIEAQSGEAALATLSSGGEVSLLITDFMMPGISGPALIEKLRSRQPSLPALIITGYADPDGLSSYLPRLAKPFRQNELAAKVASLLERADA